MTDLRPVAILWWDENTNQIHVSSMNVSEGDLRPQKLARSEIDALPHGPSQIEEEGRKIVFDYKDAPTQQLKETVDLLLTKLSSSKLSVVANEGGPPKQPRLN